MYCTQALHLSEHAAYGRMEAARAARRFPVLLERLADGSITLTTVTLLAPHLTVENHRDLLEQARHRSRREVEALAAAHRPEPPVPASIRRLPAPRAAPAPRPPVIAPLAPECYKVQLTASAETYAKLRLAQDLPRHQIPDGDVAQVLDRALTVLVDTLLKQKVAATDRPRAGKPPRPGSRHIPAAVRRAVWARDGGRCAFVSRSGRRCTERGFLEFHHVRPYAEGGPATVGNIELRCRAHNGYEAERVFGP